MREQDILEQVTSWLLSSVLVWFAAIQLEDV